MQTPDGMAEADEQKGGDSAKEQRPRPVGGSLRAQEGLEWLPSFFLTEWKISLLGV